MLAALIMAGGKGERFWPKSRTHRPKQLLSIFSDCSMIEETVKRLSPLIEPEHIFISTAAHLESSIQKVLGGIPKHNYIIEPVGRNTAPCIGLSALIIRKRLGNVPMVVLPSDHVISDRDLFQRTVAIGARLASEQGKVVTIGIQPGSAHTGYGYIQQGQSLGALDDIEFFRLAAFKEKPDLKTAQQFLEAGTYLWNSGMFLWTCDTILTEITTHLPGLDQVLRKIAPALDSPEQQRVIERFFPEAESISIDYGILEKTAKGVLVRGTFDWDDVGNWLALEHYIEKDQDHNTVKAPFQAINTRNCLIVSDRQLIATIGVKDLIVVSTDDAVLICHRNDSESIKNLLAAMKNDDSFKHYL
ncbi:mannose-1-phosphate guanylyltransferase [bacterium]|nr:mannose-1-phosphate guanylyltransferase [bacterium]